MSAKLNYIEQAADAIVEYLVKHGHYHPERDEPEGNWRLGFYAPLWRQYAALAWTTGVETTLQDVHNAWAAWQCGHGEGPSHLSIVPFTLLQERTQELDRPYCDAIVAYAEQRKCGRRPLTERAMLNRRDSFGG